MTRFEGFYVAADDWRSFRDGRLLTEPEPEPPPPDPDPELTGDRFFYTDAQITEFRNRMTGDGPFYSTGQGFYGAQDNAPGDGERALGHANTFISNPSQYTFYQTFGNGTSLEPGDPWPGTGFIHNMRAAWCYMTMPSHPNNTAWRDAARDMLLSVAQHSTHDFANSDMYRVTYPGFYPSPIFATAGGMLRNLKTYDMLGRDTFTQAQRDMLDKWFYSYANWQMNQIQHEAVRNRILDVTTDPYINPNIGYGTGLRTEVAYNGGDYISAWLLYSNRMTACYKVASQVANYLKFHNLQPPTAGGSQPTYGWWTIDYMLDYARGLSQAWLMGALHPDGWVGDFVRAQQSNAAPTTGWSYGANEIRAFIDVAKAFSRRGDNSLWDYGTTVGYNNTAGSPNDIAGVSGFPNKTIQYAQWMHSRYVNDGWGRVVTGNNGVTGPLVRDDTFHDCHNAAQASSHYPSDSLLMSSWTRTGNGFPGYPSSPQTQGGFNGFDGEMGMFIGLIEVGGV